MEKVDLIMSNINNARNICEVNAKLAFFKIPKYIIIKDIITLLNDEEIKALGQTCKIFKSLIYSPFTFQILLTDRGLKTSQTNNIQQNILYTNAISIVNEEYKRIENTNDFRSQLNILKTIKDLLTNRIKILEESIKNHKKEIKHLKNEVNQNQDLDLNNTKRISALESRINDLEFTKSDHEEVIQNLNSQYHKIIIEKESIIKSLNEDNNKLKSDKDKMEHEVNSFTTPFFLLLY